MLNAKLTKNRLKPKQLLFSKSIPLLKQLSVLRIFLFLCFPLFVLAQAKPPPTGPQLPKRINEKKITPNSSNANALDSLSVNATDADISITDYLIISQARDTIHVDTTLTMAKYYKFNSQRSDNFAYLPLNNSGQALNPLSLETWHKETAPAVGFKAKESQRFLPHQFGYYHVPTPLSELFFKTTQSQGQSTDVLITANIHPRLNYAIGYRGHRSLGKYQHQISGRSQLRFSTRYENPNGRYRLRLQIMNQKISQQENGGLNEASIQDFVLGDDEFFDRERLEVNFENATNNFIGKRYVLEQDYLLLRSNDSLQTPRLRLGYRMQSDIQDNRFSQDQAYSGYGDLAANRTKPYDQVYYSLRQFDAYTILTSPTIGWFSGHIRHHKYSYKEAEQLVNPSINEDAYAVGGEWRKRFGSLDFRASAEIGISGDRIGNYVFGEIKQPLFSSFTLTAGLRWQQQHPGFVFEQFTSSYADYQWKNTPEMEQRTAIFAQLSHPHFGKLSLTTTHINNYAYYLQPDAASLAVTPMQLTRGINLLQLDLETGVKWGVFRMDMKLRGQQLSDNKEVMPMPSFIGRTALYYEDHWFENALFLNLGVSARYFSSYKMRAYHPLLAAFVVQPHQEIEGYPIVNAFFNMKIRQTRLFFVFEHVNANRKAANYYAAPGYPYRDMLFRFGLVWNFFQ